MSLKIAVYGKGAREEALKDVISRSPLCKKLVDVDDNPDLIIFGPEQPICDGLVDMYRENGVKCIGVSHKFSRLESSKLFAKVFMTEHGIKCAKLLTLEAEDFPQVVKFDGLCKGKGVKVVYNHDEKALFTRKFTGEKYFIEEYLDGDEISVMSYFNGKKLINFLPARDFKRLNSDKTSPNTAGMGAYCPVNLTEEQNLKLDIYLKKLETALLKEKADFAGFIYSGLIWARGDWYVLEYNVRLGDPECQALLNLLDNDFLSILLQGEEPLYKKGYSATLTIAAKGYPYDPIKGDKIVLPESKDVKVYLAAVKNVGDELISDGGRVLSLAACGDNPFAILKDYAEKIEMENKYYRTDVDITK